MVESVKAASDVYAPASGEVVAVNQSLDGAPATINEDAEGKGWFFRLKLAAPEQFERSHDRRAVQGISQDARMTRNGPAMTHQYRATVKWRRGGAKFTDQRYSRGHEWSFDGGMTVPASSSPLSVRLPYSVAEAVDPEEALVAALASCHMLTFLYVAAKQGFVVDDYADDAVGEMTKNERGKLWVSKVILSPAIVVCGREAADARTTG